MKKYEWNLKNLYESPTDPQIKKDIDGLEKSANLFAKTYDTKEQKYTTNFVVLLQALKSYEKLSEKANGKSLLYFYFLRDIDASNAFASAQISLIENRMASILNNVIFFKTHLGTISESKQKSLLSDARFKQYIVFLERIFDDAKHVLSIPEEKILNLMSIPAYNMWISGNQKMLNQKMVTWNKKKIPLAQALGMVSEQSSQSERNALSDAISNTLRLVAPFSEAEINAVVTQKKIEDEARGFTTAYEQTVKSYRNDPTVVKNLVDTVTRNFPIAHRFYKLKSKLLNLKKLSYSDRAAKVGTTKTKYTFEHTIITLKSIFGGINPKYASIFDSFIREGRIDVFPRVGKKSGAYCWGSHGMPTYVLLNHTNTLRSYCTTAHEMGHAFHTEFSASQGVLYHDYSTSLAETASTLFEAIALEGVFDTLSDSEKIVVLHDKINDEMATIFRQIACFNYESDIHNAVRTQGFISEKELAQLHNINMGAYLGPLFTFTENDGYYFVHWGHIRHFFYVYSYAFGMLVSKALLRRYRQDPSFWASIEKFLSAGGKDSPENILKEIGIDVTSPEFFREGLKEIEDDITKLEKLTANTKASAKTKLAIKAKVTTQRKATAKRK